MIRPGLYRWASEHPRHGMPDVRALEAQGWMRVENHPWWPDSWLMRQA